jgi:hypothetical protein
MQITDPAPMAANMKQGRHRGVRCICFVSPVAPMRLSLKYSEGGEQGQSAHEAPNEQMPTDVETSWGSDCRGKPSAFPNTIQHRVIGADICKVYQKESHDGQSKANPSPLQAPDGQRASVLNLGERDGNGQSAGGECRYVLGKAIERGHLFFECLEQDFRVLLR